MRTPVVLITGALTGIGRATAFAFAKEGARVVVSGRHDDEGRRLVAGLRELGGDVEFFRADVRCDDDVRSLVDAAVAHFGRLDAAVNNAGTEGTPGPVTEQSGTAERKAGLVGTIPLHRMGTPDEIAEAIVFLASDKAAFITGATLAADGGATAV